MGEKQPSKWKEILLKILYWVGEILTVFIAGLSVLLALSVRWMFATWTNLSMDELVYHLTAPLDGTNTDMIWDYVRVCAVPTILVIFFLILILIAWRKKEKVHLFRGIINLVALVGIIVMLGYTWTELGVGDYLKDQNTESKFIEDEYVDPTDVEVVFPEQKRNLIYIFLESMETTYSDVDDGGAFDENVIPELTEIAQTNEDFSGADPKLNGGYSLAGTTWTMGAMFAQTSGLPLNISISANDMDTQDSFFPGVTTLGDILSDAGYTQTNETTKNITTMVPEDAEALSVLLFVDTKVTKKFNVSWIKLEIGNNATGFCPRCYGEELNLCMRYYERVEYNVSVFACLAKQGKTLTSFSTLVLL